MMTTHETCAICGIASGDVSLRNEAMVCSACGSFFRKTTFAKGNGAVSLRCKNGDNKCFAEVEGANATVVHGKIWRFACPRCRYDKCLRIGMKATRRNLKRFNNSSPPTTTTTTSTISSPTSLSSCQIIDQPIATKEAKFNMEDRITDLVVSFNDLKLEMRTMPGFRRNCRSTDDAIDLFLDNIDSGAQISNRFIRKMPWLFELNMEERCALFTAGLARIMLLNFATMNKPVSMALADEQSVTIASEVPYLCLKEKALMTMEIRKMIDMYQINLFELAILGHQLFFDNSGESILTIIFSGHSHLLYFDSFRSVLK